MKDDTKWILAYAWILSLIGAVFAGHETARIVHGMDREIIALKQNEQLQNCHRIKTGEIK
jgi:hypothetical protein